MVEVSNNSENLGVDDLVNITGHRPHCSQAHLRWSITSPSPARWGRDKMAAILQTIFTNSFSGMKIVLLWLKFHIILFQSNGGLVYWGKYRPPSDCPGKNIESVINMGEKS